MATAAALCQHNVRSPRPTSPEVNVNRRSSHGCNAVASLFRVDANIPPAMGTIVPFISDLASASRLRDGWSFTTRELGLADTGRIADAAEELAEAATAYDQPAIFAFRTSRISVSRSIHAGVSVWLDPG